MLARKYFEEAVRLDPGDARYLGFYASLLMAEGTIHKDDKLVRRGYYTMREAVAAWPEFNYFTAGYTASALPYDSPRFKEGVEAAVAEPRRVRGRARGPRQPGLRPLHAARDKQGPKRVCWNSWIAPHNFEGFFLNFGDMLVKAGDPATAVKMYGNARLTPDYATWPYKQVLEERIVNAAANVEAFRRQGPPRARRRSWSARPTPAWGATSSDRQSAESDGAKGSVR